MEEALAAGLDEPDAAGERWTVASWVAEWLGGQVRSRVAAGTLAPRTASSYAAVARRHLIPSLGQIPLADLRSGHVETLMAAMIQAGAAPRTAAKARSVLSGAIEVAIRDGHLDGPNPARQATPPTPRQDPPSSFAEPEITALRRTWADTRYAPIWEVLLGTGLRISEVVALRWPDVDLDAATLTVTQTRHAVPAAPEVGMVGHTATGAGKTAGSAATIPIPERVLEVLSDLPGPRRGWVFETSTGTPFSARNLARAWAAVVEAAGIPAHSRGGKGRGLHELRRTWATRLLDAGARTEDVARLGRWSSAQVLLRHYAGSPEDRLRAVIELPED